MTAHVQHHRPIPVSLKRLFPTASFIGCSDVIATDVAEDSRLVSPGTVFAVIRGTQIDGGRFVEHAIQQGSPAILVEQPLTGISVPQCIVRDTRLAYSQLCDAILGYPARRLRICGVTGTNGKSTTAWLLHSILTAAGEQSGLLGTIEYSDSISTEASTLTTPDSRRSANWFRRMVDVGASNAVIEISSHALHQRRVAAIPLAAAIVTNVTRDHFDYHGHFEDYLAAKSQILSLVAPGGCIVINADDAGSAQLIEPARQTGRKVITIGLQSSADLQAEILDESIEGSRFRVRFSPDAVRQSDSAVRKSSRGSISRDAAQAASALPAPHLKLLPSAASLFEVYTSLPARHNVMNCLAATAAALHFGVPPETIASGVRQTRTIPGRLERIDVGQPFHVFVDYAHTDDALRRVVDNVKSLTSGRTICLFGAGGDRDCTKRPLLAEAASHAEMAVVTSDNPRTESPAGIIEDILAGFPNGYSGFHIEPDRRRAIAHAFSLAESNDCVLIAGKGHESSQIIGAERHPFDDRLVAAELLRELPSVRSGSTSRLTEVDQ